MDFKINEECLHVVCAGTPVLSVSAGTTSSQRSIGSWDSSEDSWVKSERDEEV